MTIGVVVFPGSNCDRDVKWATEGCLGFPTRFLWHETRDLSGCEAVVLPGGFSYGDYLRCGAIARFAPVLEALVDFVEKGGKVLGICNGFQVLTELGLLPGALTRNKDLHFICENTELIVNSNQTSWLNGFQPGDQLLLPIAHGEGCFQCSESTLHKLEDENAIALRYLNNPNGSINDIAGITNSKGNVLGLMPHPERACDPSIGGTDGRKILEALIAK
ncbi:phosphoribosylformylglycinamidine synthase subunit PurQ [Prochlorococcus sp. MIT 1307]|uniref:phosphoribosylformylglycinamidine synthase subunit PurQ n=1 Tax=Prochlorococcus sp. MIT 1307 TaxID=3096219 RepID=UPI002A749074|nr:phosphoribosylformylglycinamidine synthase subunit PurQ [Prochlorococcus sp. MIT 1307]